MAEDLLRRKLAHGFAMLDADGDGFLTERDHEVMGRRSAAGIGIAPGDDWEIRLEDAYREVWRRALQPHADESGRLDVDGFVAAVQEIAKDAQAAEESFGRLASAYFDVADRDLDEFLDLDEYRAFVNGITPSLDDEETARGFAHMDTDEDGAISRPELVAAVLDFWTGTEPGGPGSHFLGDPSRYGGDA
ncbi:EF-hand domain-containing protein [Streptomyces sp. ODS28]|uniref:EF-hand domain-containing protein n=1 Tax=Streptomyces sp. ODS28 TaxID=3136688 RepID=UPI0031F1554C